MNAVNVVATYNIDGAVQGGPLAGDVQLASVRLDQYPRWPEGGSGSLLVRVLREGARAAPALACASLLNELDFLSLAQLRETSPSSRSSSASGVDSAAAVLPCLCRHRAGVAGIRGRGRLRCGIA